MFFENQGFAEIRVRRIPLSPPDKSFIFNSLQNLRPAYPPLIEISSQCNKGFAMSLWWRMIRSHPKNIL
jgi:hypothetical protein